MNYKDAIINDLKETVKRLQQECTEKSDCLLTVMGKFTELMDKINNNFTEEICPYCNETVKLPPHLGIYECPACKRLIIACSMCKTSDCGNCKYIKLTEVEE